MPRKPLRDPNFFYRSPGHRQYLRRELRKGNTRPTAQWVYHLRYEDYDYATIGFVYQDLYDMLDNYPPDERNELLKGIMSPSAE